MMDPGPAIPKVQIAEPLPGPLETLREGVRPRRSPRRNGGHRHRARRLHAPEANGSTRSPDPLDGTAKPAWHDARARRRGSEGQPLSADAGPDQRPPGHAGCHRPDPHRRAERGALGGAHPRVALPPLHRALVRGPDARGALGRRVRRLDAPAAHGWDVRRSRVLVEPGAGALALLANHRRVAGGAARGRGVLDVAMGPAGAAAVDPAHGLPGRVGTPPPAARVPRGAARRSPGAGSGRASLPEAPGQQPR